MIVDYTKTDKLYVKLYLNIYIWSKRGIILLLYYLNSYLNYRAEKGISLLVKYKQKYFLIFLALYLKLMVIGLIWLNNWSNSKCYGLVHKTKNLFV